VPIVKNKNGDITSLDSYRGVTVNTCLSKLFETGIMYRPTYEDYFRSSPLQFGFKQKMGCSHAIFLLRSVMGFYVSKGTTLNIAFLDLSKAFDKVSHNILFQKLMQRNVLGVLVKLLHSWYGCCSAVVRWGHNSAFQIQCGVRHGGALSPVLFALYIDGIIEKLEGVGLGCWLGDVFINCILYADDIVLISPTVHSLQIMLDVCASFAQEVDMKFNSTKSVVMRVGTRFKLPCRPVMLCDKPLSFVNEAKYFGVCLLFGLKFKVSLHYVKCNFFRSFNSVYQKCCHANHETVVLKPVNSFL